MKRGATEHGARPPREVRAQTALVCVALAALPCAGSAAQDPAGKPAAAARQAWASEGQPRGLRVNEPGALAGFTLIVPLNSLQMRLVDMQGEIRHSWSLEQLAAGGTEFLDNGQLLHCTRVPDNPRFKGWVGGRVVELDWDGNLVWEYVLAGADLTQHHDFTRLPSGNVVVIAWEHHTREDAIARGRDPATVDEQGLHSDVLLEIRPTPPAGGEIVWSWRAWDHLVQDRDEHKPGYGKPADHPGRIDINGGVRRAAVESDEQRRAREADEDAMRGIGYIGDDEEENASDDDPFSTNRWTVIEPDWMHTNAVAYHPELDLLVISPKKFCELWVIDHSTTTAESAGAAGGVRGRGGELLYRWGNPEAWGAGGLADRQLFYQHSPTWIGDGTADDPLRLLVFNNGASRPGGNWSSVDELLLPFDRRHGFLREPGLAFEPATPAWSYSDKAGFYSPFISGASRLPNGNTLICDGARGRVFEVTPDHKVVWDYWNPFGGEIQRGPKEGKSPAKALFRAARIPLGHPGLEGKFP